MVRIVGWVTVHEGTTGCNRSRAISMSQSCGGSDGVRPEIVAFKSRPLFRTSTGNAVPTVLWGATAGETPAIPRYCLNMQKSDAHGGLR